MSSEEFEAWCAKRWGGDRGAFVRNPYVLSAVQFAWAAWSARDARIAERDAEIARLRTALRFYANREHYILDDDEDFEAVSGEPLSWLHSGLEESTTMIEDGSVALLALRGIDAEWRDGDADYTPQPIAGEVSCAATKP